MDNFKFILSSIIIIVLLSFAGYWAFTTIESGSSHVDNQKQKELEDKNKELEKEVIELKKEISLLQVASLKPAKEVTSEVKNLESVVASSTGVTISKYQSLINDLQKLVDGNIYLKNKSQGPAVGTLQKFFNIYNNTSNKIDNDYGVSTATVVKSFQKAQGLVVDGETGPNTYKKMITWLKAH